MLTGATEFKAAENNGVPFAVILGEEELANGQVKYVTPPSGNLMKSLLTHVLSTGSSKWAWMMATPKKKASSCPSPTSWARFADASNSSASSRR